MPIETLFALFMLAEAQRREASAFAEAVYVNAQAERADALASLEG